MSQPYVGECRMGGWNFAPAGWNLCAGQLLAISENPTLFNLIGTTYGGDGQTTFQLPDLQGRVPIHQGTGPGGQGFVIGTPGGTENVTLTVQQIPVHSHVLIANGGNGNSNLVQNNLLAANATQVYRASPTPTLPMGANSITPSGGSQAHNNVQPFQAITWIISLFGIYPSPS
jgi:microcystin-dependent protein